MESILLDQDRDRSILSETKMNFLFPYVARELPDGRLLATAMFLRTPLHILSYSVNNSTVL